MGEFFDHEGKMWEGGCLRGDIGEKTGKVQCCEFHVLNSGCLLVAASSMYVSMESGWWPIPDPMWVSGPAFRSGSHST